MRARSLEYASSPSEKSLFAQSAEDIADEFAVKPDCGADETPVLDHAGGDKACSVAKQKKLQIVERIQLCAFRCAAPDKTGDQDAVDQQRPEGSLFRDLAELRRIFPEPIAHYYASVQG